MKRGLRSRRILWLVIAATAVPIVVLTSLGVRILYQDRDAERQRQSDTLQVSAQQAALQMATWLLSVDAQLAKGDGIVLSASGPVAVRKAPLLYRQPLLIAETDRIPELAAAEALEYQARDFAAAAAAYRVLTTNGAVQVRAGALLGLAGVLGKSGDLEGALKAYGDLGRFGETPAGGEPAELVARNARCRLLERAGQTTRLRAEAREFAAVLYQGGWRIDRPTFENYQADLQRWGAPPVSAPTLARTRAAVDLWQDWRDGDLPGKGHRITGDRPDRILAVWNSDAGSVTARLITSEELDGTFRPLATAQGLRLSAYDDEDHLLFGERDNAGPLLSKGSTRLPFALRVSALDPAAADTSDRRRRAVLIGSLSLAFVLIIAAGYGLYRTTARELALARQQADFVSSVSHEFRTPLTSMRHLTDLLAARQIASEERRAHYYQLLAHETERLHRLVEGLLSFGRLEAGGYAWKLEAVDLGSVVSSAIDDFRQEAQARSHEISCRVEPDLPAVRADRDAFTRALWNLLDNAAKYSAAASPISVSVTRVGRAVQVAVGDRGIGIQADERASVFEKFVRGADAKRAGIGGVGIGLALVTRIVEAHGGSVQLESEPGRGSTFTLVIPCIES